VLGQVFHAGLERTAGSGLAGPLSSGHAGAVIARGAGQAHLAHQAFAHGLDLIFTVAAIFGLVAAVVVIAFVRKRTPASAATQEQKPSLASASQTS